MRRIMWGGLLVGALALALLGQFILLARSAQWVIGLAVYLAALAFLWFGLRELEGDIPWLRPGREEDRRIPDTGQAKEGASPPGPDDMRQAQTVAPTGERVPVGPDMERAHAVAPTLASVQPSPFELGTDLDEGDEAALTRAAAVSPAVAAADVPTSSPLEAAEAAPVTPVVEVPPAPPRPLRPLWNADLVGMWSGAAALADPRLKLGKRAGEMALWLLTVAGAFYGQYLMVSHPEQVNQGLTLMGGAALAFLGLVLRHELAAAASRHWAGLSPWRGLQLNLTGLRTIPGWVWHNWFRLVLVGAGFLVALFNFGDLLRKPGNVSYSDNFALWGISIVCIVAASATWPLPNPLSVLRRHRLDLGLLLVLTVIAAGLRFVYLGAVPNIISGDEGRIGELSLQVMRGEIRNMFSTTIGHGTLNFFLRAWVFQLLGVNMMSLRILDAIVGTLTIPVTYLLARRMFDTRVAVLAAALLTVSHFHLHFSRVNVNGGIMDAFWTALAVWLFYAGLRSHRPLTFALSALSTGLLLFIYMGGRLTILFLLAFMVVLALVNPRLFRANLAGFSVFLLVYAVTALPMLAWLLNHPNEFSARFTTVGIFQSGWLANEIARTGRSQWQILLEQFRISMLTFNFLPARAFYLSSKPMLDLLTAVPFVLGLVYSMWRAFDERFLLLNAWFWSAVIGGQVLMQAPDVSAYRITIVMPAVMMLAAVGWFKLLDSAAAVLTPNRYVWATASVAFLALVAYINLSYYFVEYAPNCRYEDRGTRVPSLMGSYLGTLDRNTKAYLYGEPWLTYGTHMSVDFLSGHLPVMNVKGNQTATLDFVDRSKPATFIFVPEQASRATLAQQAFPGGQWIEFKDCQDVVLYAYEVDPRAR